MATPVVVVMGMIMAMVMVVVVSVVVVTTRIVVGLGVITSFVRVVGPRPEVPDPPPRIPFLKIDHGRGSTAPTKTSGVLDGR